MQELDGHLTKLVGEISGLIAGKLLGNIGAPEDDLLASGLLDSLSLVQLLADLEEHFEIRIPLETLQIEDIRSIQSIASLVDRLAAHSIAANIAG